MIKPANGTSGFLLRTLDHIVFRVYGAPGEFTDYDLRHSDLCVTIADSDAAFYIGPQTSVLDNGPITLGLTEQYIQPDHCSATPVTPLDCDPTESSLSANTPREMLEFLAGRFEFSGICDSVAQDYACNIRKLLAAGAT